MEMHNTQCQSYFLEISDRIELLLPNLIFFLRLDPKISRCLSSDIGLSELTLILVLSMFGVFRDSN